MWVRLTRRGCQAAQSVVSGLTLQLLQADALFVGERVDVNAPYACWLNVQQALIAHVFGPQGGKRAEVPARFVLALKTITKALNFIDTHPALSGKAAMGWHGLEIPAWGNGDDDYTPYPRPGKMFVTLSPVWDKARNGGRVTRWLPLPNRQTPVHEDVHLLLSGHPVTPRAGNPDFGVAAAE